MENLQSNIKSGQPKIYPSFKVTPSTWSRQDKPRIGLTMKNPCLNLHGFLNPAELLPSSVSFHSIAVSNCRLWGFADCWSSRVDSAFTQVRIWRTRDLGT